MIKGAHRATVAGFIRKRAMLAQKYPLPRSDDDPKFNLGLISDVEDVLVSHGFPPIENKAHLLLGLYRFIYGTEEAE